MKGKEFAKISEELKMEIEKILKDARAEHFTSETIEIYQKVFQTLRESGPDFLKKQKLFPFNDTVLAWSLVLKELGLENEGMKYILAGIILATVYERRRRR